MMADWQGRRVLVTGSAGVIGQVLVQKLVERGAQVLSADIQPAAATAPGVEHVQANLAKEIPLILGDFDAQVVFHLAATFERTEEESGYWQTSFDNNVLLSHMLLRALVETPSLETLAFTSSYLIYDPRLYLGASGVRLLKETDAIACRNLVGLAKYFTERELEFVAKTQGRFRAISARIYRVHGRDSRDVISRWVQAALRGETLKVYGQAGRFDYILADDVAEGLLRLVEAKQARGVVNLGSGTPRSIGDIISLLKARFAHLRISEQNRPGPVEASGADMRRFQELTGWLPPTALEEGIRQIITHYRLKASSLS